MSEECLDCEMSLICAQGLVAPDLPWCMEPGCWNYIIVTVANQETGYRYWGRHAGCGTTPADTHSMFRRYWQPRCFERRRRMSVMLPGPVSHVFRCPDCMVKRGFRRGSEIVGGVFVNFP